MNTSEFTLNAVSGNGLILKIDLHNLKKAALVLRAVNHKLRQQILKLIDEHGRV
ncbi:MAG: regulatory protein ArsR, partial [Chitinophagaceae bacterium]|nr:regulatory protein ArsR [Chitinophagaceae bacterium]